LSIIVTFILTVFSWIFFRAESLGHALNYISGIFSPSLLTIPVFPSIKRALMTIVLVISFVIVEYCGREYQYAISKLPVKSNALRLLFYFVVLFSIWFCGNSFENIEFIYFQF
jgi:hypothetical protein